MNNIHKLTPREERLMRSAGRHKAFWPGQDGVRAETAPTQPLDVEENGPAPAA